MDRLLWFYRVTWGSVRETKRMGEQHTNQTFAGPCAFCLMCAGLLLPIAIALLELDFWLIVGTAAVAQLGAMICGVIGWRDLTGKVAAIGAGLLLLLLISFVAFVVSDVGIRRGTSL